MKILALPLSLLLSPMLFMIPAKSTAQLCDETAPNILLIDATVDDDYYWPFFWNNDDENGDDIAYAGALIDDDDDGKHDDGVVIVGETDDGEPDNKQAFIILLNEFGQTAWTYPLPEVVIRGGGLDDVAYSVIQGSNDNIIVCGTTQTNNVGTGYSNNVWFFELDLTGALVSGSEQMYGGSGQDEGWDIIEDVTNDQYVIVGRAGDADPPDGDLDQHTGINGAGELWVFAIDCDDYTINWEKTYVGGWPNGSGKDWARSISIDADGKYLVSGYCSSCEPDKTQYEAWLLKIEPDDGTLIDKKAYGYNPSSGSRDQGSNDAIALEEGSNPYYVATGIHHPSSASSCFSGGQHDTYVFKAEGGNLGNVWSPPGCESQLDEGKNYGGAKKDDGQSITRTCDGDYLVVGGAGPSAVTTDDIDCNHDTDGQSPHTSDAWIIKMNSSGVIQWEETLGDVFEDEFHEILQLEDGSFIAIGEFGDDGNDEGQNAYVVKFEFTACAAPTNLSATTVADCKIKFDWDGHSCATGYVLQYRKGVTAWTTVPTTLTEHTTGTIDAGTYEWRVTARCSPNVTSSTTVAGTTHTLSCRIGDEITADSEEKLSVNPQPSDGSFRISFSSSSQSDVNTVVYIKDYAGRIVEVIPVRIENGELDFLYSSDHLSSSFYFLSLLYEGKSYQTKLVIQ